MHLFGRKKKPEPQAAAPKPKAKSLPDAIVNNKEAILTLEKRQTFIERKIELQIADAKEKARNKDKRGALMALKRKKMLTAELEQLQNARLTLEQQIMSLESTQTQQVAVGALSTGVEAQKHMQAQLDIDKVEDLMDDIKEQQDMQQEIAQVGYKLHQKFSEKVKNNAFWGLILRFSMIFLFNFRLSEATTISWTRTIYSRNSKKWRRSNWTWPSVKRTPRCRRSRCQKPHQRLLSKQLRLPAHANQWQLVPTA
jgi:hypothetical protein